MNDLHLDLTVRIRQGDNYSNDLELSERYDLQASNFLEVCEILSQFHRLAEKLNQGKENH